MQIIEEMKAAVKEIKYEGYFYKLVVEIVSQSGNLPWTKKE